MWRTLLAHGTVETRASLGGGTEEQLERHPAPKSSSCFQEDEVRQLRLCPALKKLIAFIRKCLALVTGA